MSKNPPNLYVIQPPAPLNRQRGIVELRAPGENGHVWGKVTVDFYNTDEPIKNSDMVYALMGAQDLVFKEGFFYERETNDVAKADQGKTETPEA